MVRLLIRLLINAVAIWAAAAIVPGMSLDADAPLAVFLVALVFGVLNAVLKPIAKFLSFPLIILTLGIFTLIINAGLLALTSTLTSTLSISGFWPAFWGAIAVSLVSWFLSQFLDGPKAKS